MKLAKFNDANKYYQKVESYLLKDEATHCLLLGFSKALSSSQENQGNFPDLVTVEDDGIIVATAIQTSPLRKLILSKSTDINAVNLIAQNMAARDRSLPGVMGTKSEAITFARTWQSLTGQAFELAVSLKIHQLETVGQVTKTSGSFRIVRESDRSLLISWIEAFESEALGDNEPRSDSQVWFDKKLKQKSLYLWQDKVPVSMTGFSGATPNGIRINAVYTPPEYRGKGYATSCVATLSQQLLDRGYKYCFLFTDLANPTSNHIYRKIGYQPVCEISDYAFKPKA